MTMTIEKILRELVRARGLRKTAQELRINHSSLHKSIQDGSNIGLDRIQAILRLLGCELKVVRKRSKRSKTKGGCPE